VNAKDLGATSYTLVTIVCDRSGSTSGFQNDMENALKQVVKACQSSPRADNLLVRVITFENNVTEFHGFKLLETINMDDYNNSLSPGGTTALYDAMVNSIEGTNNYAKQLAQQDYDVNAIIFWMTDGADNASTHGTNQIISGLNETVKDECLESLVTVLLGVNVNDASYKSYLENIHKTCGLSQFESIENADAKSLAKLANFVSQSISSQSQALGSGGPSQSINF
jgi:hypothetical protein